MTGIDIDANDLQLGCAVHVIHIVTQYVHAALHHSIGTLSDIGSRAILSSLELAPDPDVLDQFIENRNNGPAGLSSDFNFADDPEFQVDETAELDDATDDSDDDDSDSDDSEEGDDGDTTGAKKSGLSAPAKVSIDCNSTYYIISLCRT